MRAAWYIRLWAVAGLLVAGCVPAPPAAVTAVTPSPAPALTAYWPTAGWRTSTPEEQGMDSATLARMFASIRETGLNLHSLLVIRNGYIVAEAYFPAFTADTQHDLQSVTKSVVAMLVGVAVAEGDLPGIDRPVVDFFPRRTVANVDARKRAITLEHLLTMTSGLAWDDGPDVGRMVATPDWVQYVLDRPMAATPGEVLNYNSGNVHLLSAILQQQTGKTAWALAHERLFKPLGIAFPAVRWEADPQGISAGGWGLWMKPRDLARLGYLYLNEGRWEDRQLVPAEWVRDSVEKHVAVPDPVEPWQLYRGYGWWVHDFGAYAGHGRGGQFLYVIPGTQTVVVITAGLTESQFVEPELLIRDFIMPAARSAGPLPANPQGDAALAAAIQAVQSPQPQAVPPLPTIARAIAGKQYVLDDNPIALRSFTWEFQGAEALLHLDFAGQRRTWRVGLDGLYRVNAANDRPYAAEKGRWTGDDTFVLHHQEGRAEEFDISFRFAGQAVDVRLASSLGQGAAMRGSQAP